MHVCTLGKCDLTLDQFIIIFCHYHFFDKSYHLLECRFSALGGEGRRGPGASRQGPGAGRQGPPGRRPMQDREKALEAVRNVVQTKVMVRIKI